MTGTPRTFSESVTAAMCEMSMVYSQGRVPDLCNSLTILPPTCDTARHGSREHGTPLLIVLVCSCRISCRLCQLVQLCRNVEYTTAFIPAYLRLWRHGSRRSNDRYAPADCPVCVLPNFMPNVMPVGNCAAIGMTTQTHPFPLKHLRHW
jgi:hypothetical protein